MMTLRFAAAAAFMREHAMPVQLSAGRSYVLNRRLPIPGGGGLIGGGGSRIFAPASSFNNRGLGGDARYSDSAVVLDLSGENARHA